MQSSKYLHRYRVCSLYIFISMHVEVCVMCMCVWGGRGRWKVVKRMDIYYFIYLYTYCLLYKKNLTERVVHEFSAAFLHECTASLKKGRGEYPMTGMSALKEDPQKLRHLHKPLSSRQSPQNRR